jgi:hypothetical protein
VSTQDDAGVKVVRRARPRGTRRRLAVIAGLLSLLAGPACRTGFRCTDAIGCAEGSSCVEVVAGEAYCAVPDPSCDAPGLRFEGSANASVAGACAPAGSSLRRATCTLDEMNAALDQCVLAP